MIGGGIEVPPPINSFAIIIKLLKKRHNVDKGFT
jgi:hypothetical protein